MADETQVQLDSLERSIFSLNNVTQYLTDVELLAGSGSFGHALGLTLLGLEEFSKAMHHLGIAFDFLDQKKRGFRTKRKPQFLEGVEIAFDIALEFCFGQWIQSRQEAFQILANYLGEDQEMMKQSHLAVLIQYLSQDDSKTAQCFHSLFKLRQEKYLRGASLKKDKALGLFVTKSTNPLTVEAGKVETTRQYLNTVQNFGSSITELLKKIFVSKELLARYQTFCSNVNAFWTDFYPILLEEKPF